MSTGSGPLTFLGSDFAQTFGQIVSTRIKRLANKNLVASRHIQAEKASLSVDVQRPKTPVPKWISNVETAFLLFPLSVSGSVVDGLDKVGLFAWPFTSTEGETILGMCDGSFLFRYLPMMAVFLYNWTFWEDLTVMLLPLLSSDDVIRSQCKCCWQLFFLVSFVLKDSFTCNQIWISGMAPLVCK